jgi:hypothetical protein
MQKKKKIKSGESVIVSNDGKKEVGLCKKIYTKKNITMYDVLLERGVWLEGISDNTNSSIHVVLSKLTPKNDGRLTATINPDLYDFEIKVDYQPSIQANTEI